MTSTERPRMKEFPTWGWYILIGYMLVAGFALPPELGAWALAAGWFATSVQRMSGTLMDTLSS